MNVFPYCVGNTRYWDFFWAKKDEIYEMVERPHGLKGARLRNLDIRITNFQNAFSMWHLLLF